MNNYSNNSISKEEETNTKITKIEQEIEPALYENAPEKKNTKYDSAKKLVRRFPKNLTTEEIIQEENFQERTLEKL